MDIVDKIDQYMTSRENSKQHPIRQIAYKLPAEVKPASRGALQFTDSKKEKKYRKCLRE